MFPKNGEIPCYGIAAPLFCVASFMTSIFAKTRGTLKSSGSEEIVGLVYGITSFSNFCLFTIDIEINTIVYWMFQSL